ncbi:MAG: CotH kinase family protein [Treponema sp.]|nr:CotH kinase family protein [Treponema sp.]
MKKSFFKVLPVLFGLLVFFGCKQDATLDSEEEHEANKPEVSAPAEQPAEDDDEEYPPLPDVVVSNSDYGLDRVQNLDWIFKNSTLGKTTVQITRSEWNKLCDDYRYFYKNENCVKARSYSYEKDGHSWTLKDVGFRLRGNTSRYCPQGIDNGNIQEFSSENIHGQMNADWNADYYVYANQPNNDYRQTHFKVDFEEFVDEDQKLANCMKGVALKRMDNSCTREIFCYDLFRQNGIWTAPRASHTRLIIEIVESNNKVTTIDYGVYEMFEEVNKQSLKARDSELNSAENAWKNSKGYLWKCCNDLTTGRMGEMGIEDIRIIYANDKRPSNMHTNGREDSTRVGYVWNQYSMDLKTNKDYFATAQGKFQEFITGLNALPKATNADKLFEKGTDDSKIAEITTFYNKWFDVDFFLKTYAINIMCGMDDDYWGNSNNYYLYFDTDVNGSGKIYFIPFDYDNTLGSSIKDGGFKHNPLDWGRGEDRPLMDRLLSVPEFRNKFVGYLQAVSENEYWNFTRCSQMFLAWKNMVSPYLNSKDLCYTGLGVNSWGDYGWRPKGYSLTNYNKNIYDATRESFRKWRENDFVNISEDSSLSGNGIKLKIEKIPSDAAKRNVYIDGKQVGELGFKYIDNVPYIDTDRIFRTDYIYPYVESGKTYKVQVRYYNEDDGEIEASNELSVTPTSGLGELYFEINGVKNPSFNKSTMISNNKLVINPVVKYGSTTLDMTIGSWNDNGRMNSWNRYFLLEVMSIKDSSTTYESWNHVYPTVNGFDFAGKMEDGVKEVVNNKSRPLEFYLWCIIGDDNYGNYRLTIYSYDDTKSFTLQ